MNAELKVGAVAGLPTMHAPDIQETSARGVASIIVPLRDPWLYDRVPNFAELGHGTYQIGEKTSPIAVGLRDHCLRTPSQLQQNFPRELAISEAAALAGVDAIEYRLRHTKDARLIGVLNAVQKASGWQKRPSPNPNAAVRGTTTVAGRKRQVEGGAVMGISHVLYEEMRFDESGITSRDWRTYPIATMADLPPIEVVVVTRPDAEDYGGVSEAAKCASPRRRGGRVL